MENETPNEAPNAEAEALRTQLAQAQSQAKAATDAILATVPERLRSLIPEGEPAARLTWFAKAKQAGIFEPPVVPKTDEGKPTVTPKASEFSSLPPIARMSTGYKR